MATQRASCAALSCLRVCCSLVHWPALLSWFLPLCLHCRASSVHPPTCVNVHNDAPHCSCVARQLSGLVGRWLKLNKHLYEGRSRAAAVQVCHYYMICLEVTKEHHSGAVLAESSTSSCMTVPAELQQSLPEGIFKGWLGNTQLAKREPWTHRRELLSLVHLLLTQNRFGAGSSSQSTCALTGRQQAVPRLRRVTAMQVLLRLPCACCCSSNAKNEPLLITVATRQHCADTNPLVALHAPAEPSSARYVQPHGCSDASCSPACRWASNKAAGRQLVEAVTLA
jgi:hypothetical protein